MRASQPPCLLHERRNRAHRQTQFQLSCAGFNFHSTSYNWLVVSGSRAPYRGSGTVNGQGNCGHVDCGDESKSGGVDRFRIKIWDKATGQVVYDNKMGVGDDEDPTTAFRGGSIVIHSK